MLVIPETKSNVWHEKDNIMINKDDLPQISKTFDCSCHSMLHSVRITHFPPQSWDNTGRFETIISMIITDQSSFWTRLKVSWNYLIKRVPEVAEHIIVERAQIDEIIEFLDKFPKNDGLEAIRSLAESQIDLPPDFQKILVDSLDTLYTTEKLK